MVAWSALYTDLPSKQVKVPIPNKNLIICSEDETMVVSPTIIQEELNVCMQRIPQGRAFIRPSGTEDVVRVYAEAETPALADQLAREAIHIIRSHLGG
jgi:phosphoacetylglucosamine mutase